MVQLRLIQDLAWLSLTSISPSLQQQLEGLSPDQRSQVSALLASWPASQGSQASQPREPGGLLGKMHTHGDFDAPLAEEFLIP